MAVFTLDSSCMVAAVCSWHERHTDAVAAIERRLDRGEQLAVALPALIESYAVLTRLPARYRLSPGDAWALLKANFVEHRVVVALSPGSGVALLQRLSREGIGGGKTYDCLIAECARDAKASVLLSFNVRDFEIYSAGVSVVDPSAHPRD